MRAAGVLQGRLLNRWSPAALNPIAVAQWRALAREFAAVRALRRDIEKPVWYNLLRLPEGETLPPECWKTLCDDYMQRMGFTPDHPRCYVMHDDAEGQHFHILASSISASGAVYLGRKENFISTRIIQRIERVYRLILTQGATYTGNRKAARLA